MTRPMNLLIALCALVIISSGALAQSMAIVGGTIIDGNGGAPIQEGVILIEGKRIVAVGGKSTAIPPHASRIAAAGKYVIPGLMDANVHLVADIFPVTLIRYENRYDQLAVEAAQIALRSGLTTVFDSWGPREYLIKARDAINAGRVPGSRVYLAGNIVGLGGPFSQDFLAQSWDGKPIVKKENAFEDVADRVDAIWQENVGPELVMMSPEQVRQEIRTYLQKGVDFVKYAATTHGVRAEQYIQFSPRVQHVIVEEAHRAGRTVQTHTSSAEGLYLAVEAGVDLMQHCDAAEPQAFAEIVPLIVERGIPCAILAHPSKGVASSPRKEGVTTTSSDGNPNQRALLRAGAVILLSTDAGVISSSTWNSSYYKKVFPRGETLVELGEGHFRWLLAVEQMGMKPMDALMAATRNIARAYKVDQSLGTLEKGKIADLLILGRNPLESAANYRSISLVIKEGKIIDRDALPTPKLLTAESAPRTEGS